MPDRVMRLIDLRWLPADDLTVLRLGVAQQQLALDRIAPIQIWVVDLAITRGWAALDFTARFLGLKRLRDPRNPSGQNFIHTVGGRLSDAEIAAIKEVGLDVVLGMESIGATSKSLEDYLSPVTPWQSSPDDRPVADVVAITTGVLDGELIHVIGTSAFIDLRRATPEAIENGVAITRIEAGLLGLPTPIKRITWVTAPWVLELVDADRTARIEKLASSLSASIDHCLAVYSAGGEPTPEHPLMQRFRPAADLELLQMLHDAYYTRAWKQPHL